MFVRRLPGGSILVPPVYPSASLQASGLSGKPAKCGHKKSRAKPLNPAEFLILKIKVQMNETTRNQYTDWLSQQRWNYFFTGTFRDDYSPNSARRAGERFFSQAKGLELGILFIERGDLYGKVHLHGLLRYHGENAPTATAIWNSWWKRYGRAKVEIPRSQEDVSGYCSKYILKHAKDETYFLV